MKLLIFSGLTLILFSCESDLPDTKATFNVTIENVSSGEIATPLSGGIYLTKKDGFPLFFTNSQDYGNGLAAIAGDGIIDPLFNNLSENPEVILVGSFTPIPPGTKSTFELEAEYGDFFNFATMFVQSNDLFYSFPDDGLHLFEPDGKPRSGDFSHSVFLWDVGQEINQEPYVGSFQPGRQSQPGEGQPENSVVRLVNDGFTYPETCLLYTSPSPRDS